MSATIFGAYDIRGRYPNEINEEIVKVIASALKKYFEKKAKTRKAIVLGRDVRLSSPKLHRVIKRELSRSGRLRVIDVGLTTTPMFYFLVNRLRAVGGIMITASHNPKSWNGLKIVGRSADTISGFKVLKLTR